MEFPDRITDLKESYLNKWDSEVKNRIVSGEDIQLLNLGQPGFACPDFVKEAIVQANGKEKNNIYGHTGGSDGLRNAVSSMQKEMNGFEFEKDEIIITNGAKEALFLAFASLVNPGDEVIVITPCWPTYIQAVKFFGGIPVTVDVDHDFHLDVAAIEGAISGKTRVIVINNPNNPSGAVYGEQELSALSLLAVGHDLMVISDEVYGSTVYDGAKHIPLVSFAGMRERTIIVDGFSKALSMTGYRLGYAISSGEMIGAMVKAKSNINGNTNSFFQEVLEDVITNRYDAMKGFIDYAQSEYAARRRFLCGKLTDMGVEYAKPEGAFYVFAKIPAKLGLKSLEFAQRLVDEAGVAVAPGIVFGESFDDYVRIQFSAPMEVLEESARRIAEYLG